MTDLRNSEMFLCLRMIEDDGFPDITECLAHVLQEGDIDVIVEIRQRHLLRKNLPHIVLVDLTTRQQPQQIMPTALALNFKRPI